MICASGEQNLHRRRNQKGKNVGLNLAISITNMAILRLYLVSKVRNGHVLQQKRKKWGQNYSIFEIFFNPNQPGVG